MSLNLDFYRYGEALGRPGLALGVAREAPGGVDEADWSRLGYFDLWLPVLAPSRELMEGFDSAKISFKQFARAYRQEMAKSAPREAMQLVASAARRKPIKLGCFCADATQCHRSILRELIEQEAITVPAFEEKGLTYFSPACSMPEIED